MLECRDAYRKILRRECATQAERWPLDPTPGARLGSVHLDPLEYSLRMGQTRLTMRPRRSMLLSTEA